MRINAVLSFIVTLSANFNHHKRLFMRIDKFLWCIRLFKTRSLASDACSKGRIKLNGEVVKQAKEAKQGDLLELRINPIWRTFEILDFPKSRVSAKLVPELLKETTSEEALEELAMVQKMNASSREFGIYGRPTKKNRRNLDRFKGD